MQKFFGYGSHTLDFSIDKIHKAEKKEWNTFSMMPVLSEGEDKDICYIKESVIEEQDIKKVLQ